MQKVINTWLKSASKLQNDRRGHPGRKTTVDTSLHLVLPGTQPLGRLRLEDVLQVPVTLVTRKC